MVRLKTAYPVRSIYSEDYTLRIGLLICLIIASQGIIFVRKKPNNARINKPMLGVSIAMFVFTSMVRLSRALHFGCVSNTIFTACLCRPEKSHRCIFL